jgi:hypothetical protein
VLFLPQLEKPYRRWKGGTCKQLIAIELVCFTIYTIVMRSGERFDKQWRHLCSFSPIGLPWHLLFPKIEFLSLSMEKILVETK